MDLALDFPVVLPVEGPVMELLLGMAALAFVCLVLALGCALLLVLLID